jgi:outer membrane receptor for ferrienterochelin and colicin
MLLSKLLFTILFCTISLSIFAQTKDTLDNQLLQLGVDKMGVETEEKSLLEQKVTSTGKSEEKITDASGVIAVVTKKEIQVFGYNYLPDVLNRLTSIYMYGTAALHNNFATIRGDLTSPYGCHVLLLINGRPCRESLFVGADLGIFNTFPVDLIERIEIIRGPGAVFYGTNAFTGVINIVTIQQESNEGAVEIRTNHKTTTFGASIFKSITKERYRFNAALRIFEDDGQDFTVKDPFDTLKTMPLQNSNIGLYTDFSVGQNFSAKMYYGSTQRNVMNGAYPVWINSQNGTEFHQLYNHRFFLDVGYRHTFSSNWSASLNYTNNSALMRFELNEYHADFLTNDHLLEMTHYIKLRKNMNLTLGGAANLVGTTDRTKNKWNQSEKILDDELESELEPYFYGQIEYSPFKWWKLIAGGQYVSDDDGNEALPRLATIFYIKPELGIKAMYGKSFKAPSEIDALPVKRYSEVEGEILPEIVTAQDLQIFWQRPKFYASAIIFRNFQQDLTIREQGHEHAENPDLLEIETHANLEYQGYEFEGKFIPNHNWIITANYTNVKNKDDDDFDLSTDNNNVAQVPNGMLKGGVAYTANNTVWSLGIYYTHFSKPADVVTGQHEVPRDSPYIRQIKNPEPTAMNLLSINLIADINKILRIKSFAKTTLKMYGENLLGKRYYAPEMGYRRLNSIPYTPVGERQFFIALSVGF